METKDGRTGYVNTDGEFAFLVPIINYEEDRLYATDFKEGYAIIQTIADPPTWRVINRNGDFVSEGHVLSWAETFSDGLSRITIDYEKYGFMNTKGEIVIEPIFDEVYSFYQGYAKIKYQGRDGIINTEGKIFWSDEIMEAYNKKIEPGPE